MCTHKAGKGRGGMNWEVEIDIYVYTIDTMYKIDN